MGTARTQAAYELASNHPLIPRVWDPSPNATAIMQRFMQVQARHMARNDPWIKNLVRVLCDVNVGTGPVPVSRFEERDRAIVRLSEHFDHSGDMAFPALLREAFWRQAVDGEAFIMRTQAAGARKGRGLRLRTTWKLLTSEYVPHEFTRRVDGYGTFVNGICRIDGRVAWYAVYNRHPAEGFGADPLVVQYVPASEIYHLRNAQAGANRGEVLLASALLRAIKASTLEDSELRRKHIASLMSVAVYRPADDYDNFELPSEEEVSDMIDAAVLSPGGFIEMPYGYKAELISPPDEGANFEKALRWQLLGVCAAAGIPAHEVVGDWNSVPERMARYVGQTMERRAEIVRQDIVHQCLGPLHDDVVDAMMAEGVWLPPDEVDDYALYDHSWEWPTLPMASFKQELAILLLAEEKGVVDVAYIQKSMFGLDRSAVARSRAAGYAQDQALGFVSEKPRWSAEASDVTRRLLDAALAEEVAELDLQEASELDTGTFGGAA